METRTPKGQLDVHLKRFNKAELNGHLMDVGISAVSQCSEEDGTCEDMRSEIHVAPKVFPQDALKFKCEHPLRSTPWRATLIE